MRAMILRGAMPGALKNQIRIKSETDGVEEETM
jgi:hypothetical protein